MDNWSDIQGQDPAIEQLRQAVRADRLPHGLIFSGPTGVGKATTAAALAKLFLCEHPKLDLACGQCQSCQAMAHNTHPDFHVITKELIRYHDKTGKSKGIDLSIHVIRPEVVDKAAIKSNMGRGKVFVIEQADLMNAAAQNALLKTLEEPAGRTLLMLLTDQPSQLLATIRSRCRIIRFHPLPPQLVMEQLQRRSIDPSTAAAAVAIAGGSLGLALRWIEDGVIDSAVALFKMLDSIFSGQTADGLPDWFKAAADGYAERQLGRDELASKDQATREGLTLFLRLASEHVRQKFRQETDPDRLEFFCTIVDAITQAEAYIDSNVNVPLVFQQLAAKVVA